MSKLKKKIYFFLLASGIAVSAFTQPAVYSVDKVSFNSTSFSEIAPTLVKDGIIFCSDRKISSITVGTTFKDERLYNLYFVAGKDSTGWTSPERITSTDKNFLYYGPMCMAPDGKTVYFTSSIISGKAARKKNISNPRGIFLGDLSGTVISNVRPFEYNSSEYSVAHPSLSRDGKYLFFASDMPGGQGGSDLYYCESINGKWSKPVNMGSKVNSPAHELYPYIHPSGRLYFSSDRPANADFMGKMDVYYTTIVYGAWDPPLPLPAPINSKDDDFAFVADDNLQKGYFTRSDGGNDNIWKFRSNIIRKANCDTLQVNSYGFEFIEENAIRYDTMPVPFKFRWNYGDGSVAEGMKTIHYFKGPGKYMVKLDVINLITNQVEANDTTYNLEITNIEQPYISAPGSCNDGQLIKMNADSTNLPGWNIVQYYWNFGDETIQIGKQVEKTYVRPGAYNIQLIVTTAPDANGIVQEACVSKNINVIRKQ